MEEVDDKGNVKDGATYAVSSGPSPAKEKMNISKKQSPQRESPSGANMHTDSDSTLHPRRRESRSSRSSRHRDKSIPPPAKKTVTLSSRPVPRTSKTDTVLETASRRKSRDESAYYGFDPATVTPASSRPRSKTAAPRPSSYYGGQMRPPLANAKFHQMHHTGMPPPPLPQPRAFPHPPQHGPPLQPPWPHPPPHSYAMMAPPPRPIPPSRTAAPAHEPFAPPPIGGPRSLQQRFMTRPQTAMGHRPQGAVDYIPTDHFDADALSHDLRRLSLGFRPSMEDDSMRALPMRSTSVRPTQMSPFAPPPTAPFSRGPPPQITYMDAYDGAESAYHEPPVPYDAGPFAPAPRSRRLSIDPASSYDARPFTEVARTVGSRRNSYYGGQSVSSGSGFEDQMRMAASYQDERSGGMPLTADLLREASRGGGPRSRSTRSSGSRDESDWRQSATTRTTRSSNEEDLTIKVKGNLLFKYGDAEMQCQDGTEINIRGPPTVKRSGSSDKSSYADMDDRRSRFDRPALRSRAPSQAGTMYPPPPHLPQYGYSYGGDPDYAPSPFAPLPTNHWL